MNIKELLEAWGKAKRGQMTTHEYRVPLSVRDAARIAALAEMYPGKSESEIITDLLSVALDMVETAFPYEQGTRVITEDELGDPIYEDVGPTPNFLALSKKHLERLSKKGESDL
jgi:hypothetical protein